MRWKAAFEHGLMWGIRYTPVPWTVKHWAIRRVTRHTLVVGAALIPDAEGRVLMLRTRYSGHWITPGGGVHPGEDPLAGTRRECREELGREIAVEAMTGLYAMARTGELYVTFRCAPLAAPPRLSAEHDAFRYVRRADLSWRVRLMAADAWDTPSPAPVVRTLGTLAQTLSGCDTRLDTDECG